MNNYKTLVITSSYGAWGEANGVATMSKELVKYFSNNDLALDLVACGPKDYVETHGKNVHVFIHKPRLEIKYERFMGFDASFLLDLYSPKTKFGTDLVKRISEKEYGIVHSATQDPLGLLALSTAKKNKVASVGIYHTEIDRYVQKRVDELFGDGSKIGHFAFNMMKKWLSTVYQTADLILVPSEHTANDVRGRIVDADKPISVWGRGVDSVRFSPKHRSSVPSASTFLYVGRIEPEKNLKVLVESFVGLDEKLVLVGDGDYSGELEKLSVSSSNIRFAGKKSGIELSREYANADFFVLPSETETFGQVVQEAMASGLPVIVSDMGAPKDQTNEDHGFVICMSKDNLQAIVRKLSGKVSLQLEMGKKARETALERTWDKTFESLLSHYDTARKAK